MALNQEDKDRLSYKPNINWHKDRMYRIVQEPKPLDRLYKPDEPIIDPEELQQNFRDLSKKAKKLDDVIDQLSMPLSIPVDKSRQPRVANAVEKLDPNSKGESISYTLYRDLINQQEAGRKNVNLDFVLDNYTDDIFANSDLVQSQYIDGARSYTEIGPWTDPLEYIESSVPGTSSEQRITNTILNNILSWNEYDYNTRQIINYAQGWLGRTPDPAYLPWTFKVDVKRKLTEYTDIDQLLSQYTSMVTNLGQLGTTFPTTPMKLATDLWDSLIGKRDNDNNFFNKINELFSMNYGADLICCFVAWAGGLDTETLYALRMILQLAANGLSIEWGNLWNALLGIIEGFFRNIITGQIIALVDRIFQMVTDPIKKWLNSKDEGWRKLFLCTPIDEFINIYVVGGIEALEKWLVDLILNFWKMIEIDKYVEEGKVEIFGKKKWLSDLSELLDLIIAAVGRNALCGNNSSPTGEEVARFMEAYKVGPTFVYEYPEEERPNEYNSFVRTTTTIEKTIDPATGQLSISEKVVSKFDTGTKSADLAPTSVNIDRCLQRVMDGDVFSVQQWMEGVGTRSQEGVNVQSNIEARANVTRQA